MLNTSHGTTQQCTGKLGKYTFSKYPGYDYQATAQENGSVVLTFMFHIIRLSALEFNGLLRIGALDRVCK